MNTRLKQLRKSLKLTQKEFGEALNLSDSNISNLEKATINLTERNIKLICSTYNVNRVWFETGDGEMFLESNYENQFDFLVGKLSVENDSFKKRFIEEMLKLDDSDWIFIEKFIEKLKK